MTILRLEALESQPVALNAPSPTSGRCHRPWNVLLDLPQALVHCLGAHRGVRRLATTYSPSQSPYLAHQAPFDPVSALLGDTHAGSHGTRYTIAYLTFLGCVCRFQHGVRDRPHH